MLEDLGYAVVHNLPACLAEDWLTWARRAHPGRAVALGLDGQLGDDPLPEVFHQDACTIIFLVADDAVLVRRYSETRRRHPWSTDWETLVETLSHERAELEPLRSLCAHYVDTTAMRASELRAWVLETFSLDDHRVQLNIISFGFKRGVPAYIDLCADVRFLPNPYWDLALRPLSGHDAEVSAAVLGEALAQRWLDEQEASIGWQYEAFLVAGKSYLTIGIGCTGGRHRSVALAIALGQRLTAAGMMVNLRHRDTPPT
jgi:UPF0042 nucleotide-binding protein